MNKNKSRRWLIALALLAALCLSAAAAYSGLILPNAPSLQMRRGMQQLEEAAAGGGTKALEETLAMMSDDTLLRTIAEAAEEDPSMLVFFTPVTLERIAPKITPDQLGEIVGDSTMPVSYRTFLLETVLYVQGGKTSLASVDTNYTGTLMEMVEKDEITDDNVLEYVLSYLPWNDGTAELERLLEERSDNPGLQRRIMQILTVRNEDWAEQNLFAMAKGEAWIGLSEDALEGYFVAQSKRETPEAAAEAMATLDSMLNNPQMVKGDSLITAFHQTSELMGATHTPGYIRYLLKHREQYLATMEIHGLDYAVTAASMNCFWEIDSLLLSDHPEEVEWAMFFIENDPDLYYLDTLETLAASRGEFAARAAELAKLCREFKWVYPLTEQLATKDAYWTLDPETNEIVWKEVDAQ